MNFRPPPSLAVGAVMAIAAIAFWTFADRLRPPGAAPVESMTQAPSPALPIHGMALAMPAPPLPPDLPPPKPRIVPSPEAQKDMEDMQFALRDYRTRLGGNPTGTNAEIMKELMGGNRVQARLGPPEGQKLNEQGELLDRWGDPYFFHQLSQNEMEIRSAGPDRIMWTADDIIVK